MSRKTRHGSIGREAKASRACEQCGRRFEVDLREAFGPGARRFCHRRCRRRYTTDRRIRYCGSCGQTGPSRGLPRSEVSLCRLCHGIVVVCQRKVRYRSATDAMTVARTAAPDRLTKILRAYPCLLCEGFHLTSVTVEPDVSLTIRIVAVAATLHGAGIRRAVWYADFEEEIDVEEAEA